MTENLKPENISSTELTSEELEQYESYVEELESGKDISEIIGVKYDMDNESRWSTLNNGFQSLLRKKESSTNKAQKKLEDLWERFIKLPREAKKKEMVEKK